MNKREKEILRMALSYLSSNLDDAVEAFYDEEDVLDAPTEAEVEKLLKEAIEKCKVN